MIITVTMNPALDKTAEAASIKPGGLNRLDNIEIDAGGKGVNVSKTIKALGGETVATGFLGGGAGREIEAALRRLNIATDFIAVGHTTRTNLKILSGDYGITEFNEPGAEISPGEMAALYDKLTGYAAPGAIFVFAGSLPRGAGAGSYRVLINAVREKGAAVFLDTDGAAFGAALAAAPDYIKPNKFELSQYFGKSEDISAGECVSLCDALIGRGIRTVALSMGAQGALFVTRGEKLFAPGLPVRALSTVGAGDAMTGALAYAFDRGMGFRDAAVLAMAVSAGAVTTKGTKPPDRATVEALKPLVIISDIKNKNAHFF